MNKNFYLLASSSINQFLRFLSVLIFMTYSSPELYSEWVSIALILQYSLFLQLGSPQAMHREIAISFGNDNRHGINNLISPAIMNYFIATVFLSILLFIFNKSELVIPTLIYISLINLGNLFLLQSRARFEIKRSSLAMLLDGFLLIFCSLIFVPKYGIVGLILSLCVGSIANILICFPYSIFTHHVSRNLIDKSLYLLKEGIPLLLFNFLVLIKDTWDFVLIRFFYFNEFTIYSASHIFVRGISIFGSLMGLILIPLIAKNFGSSNQLYNTQNILIIKKLTFYLLFTIILLSLIWIPISDLFLKNFLSNFYYSKDIIAYRTISGFVGLLILPFYFFYNSSREPLIAIKYTILSIIISFLTFLLLSLFIDISMSLIISLLTTNIILFVLISSYFLRNIKITQNGYNNSRN